MSRAPGRKRGTLDPIERSLFGEWYSAVAEEMGMVLQRSSHSPNIKERRDFSCALFDARARLVAQAAHIPVHLGAMPGAVEAVRCNLPPGPGDVVILNDPYLGGTHLPDITLVSAVWIGGRARFYLASRAHHADVGGDRPGSMGLARTVDEEGVRIPPTLLVRRGRPVRAVWRELLGRMFAPSERRGDLLAQQASLAVGERRLAQLAVRHGVGRLERAAADLMDSTERALRETLRGIPRGSYSGEDLLDDDGFGGRDLRIRVAVRVDARGVTLDFRGTSPQVTGPLNATEAVARSASIYVFRCLMPTGVRENDGMFRPIRLKIPRGSLLSPRYPAAVAAGNVETSQRVTDAVLRALARALPWRIPASSAGTMNNLTVCGIHPGTGEPFSYYETLGGGAGAGPVGPGASGIQVHMTNTLNTPVEALEHAYPLRVRRYSLRRGSGGAGRHRGGEGLVREVEALTDCRAAILSDRRTRGPGGLRGGQDGRPGRNRLLLREGGVRQLPGKVELELRRGDVLRIESPGGGGWGRRSKAVAKKSKRGS